MPTPDQSSETADTPVRTVEIVVAEPMLQEVLPILRRLGEIVRLVPDGYFYPCQWIATLQNPAWPSGPSGRATIEVKVYQEDGPRSALRSETYTITLPGEVSNADA